MRWLHASKAVLWDSNIPRRFRDHITMDADNGQSIECGYRSCPIATEQDFQRDSSTTVLESIPGSLGSPARLRAR